MTEKIRLNTDNEIFGKWLKHTPPNQSPKHLPTAEQVCFESVCNTAPMKNRSGHQNDGRFSSLTNLLHQIFCCCYFEWLIYRGAITWYRCQADLINRDFLHPLERSMLNISRHWSWKCRPSRLWTGKESGLCSMKLVKCEYTLSLDCRKRCCWRIFLNVVYRRVNTRDVPSRAKNRPLAFAAFEGCYDT